MRRQQSGMALLMVLMIFAMVSVVATGIIQSQSMDIQRTTNRLGTQQARAFVSGAESVVRTGLYLDWDNDPDMDHALEQWTVDRTLPIDDMGVVFIRIADLQGRFNLNWLHPDSTNKAVWWQRFRNLLNRLQLDPLIANHLSDWLDETSQVDDTYLSHEPAYRAAYRQCKHTSELMLIEGVTTVVYQQLEPYIACLPVSSQLNINTASAQVLSVLDSQMTLSEAEQVITERGEKGIQSVSDFLALEVVKDYANPPDANDDDDDRSDTRSSNSGNNTKAWDANDFSVRTEYFEAFAEVKMGDNGDWIATSEFLVYRNASSGHMTTWYRDFSRRVARELPQGG